MGDTRKLSDAEFAQRMRSKRLKVRSASKPRPRSRAYDTCECPYCGSEASAEFVDIGVGMDQVTPFECGTCQARQCSYIEGEECSPVASRIGWHEPNPQALEGAPSSLRERVQLVIATLAHTLL